MSTSYFSERFAAMDIDQLYTTKARVLLHGLMWSVFAILLFISYKIAYKLTGVESLLLTLRMTMNNMTVFYFFWYLLLPKLFTPKRLLTVLLIVMSVPVCIYLWMTVNYLISIAYAQVGFEVMNGELKGVVSKAAEQSITEALGFRRVISQAFIVITLLSPFSLVKIVFEITKMYSKTLQLQKQQLELEIQNVQIEKDFLKSQLNPHFLFNTLNNLYGLTIRKDDAAPEVILNLSDIMSYSLYESNTEKVLLERELAFMKNYVELERMRYPADKPIVFHITGEEYDSKLFIAPLLTFPFIENAFKYGLKRMKDPFIHINITISNNTFFFHIKNDIDAMMEKREFGGIGLANTRKRLQLIYPGQHELTVNNDGKTFDIHLKIVLSK